MTAASRSRSARACSPGRPRSPRTPTFSGDDRAIEFEAEVDDGRLEIEVCESTR
jgi:hypothetical protein